MCYRCVTDVLPMCYRRATEVATSMHSRPFSLLSFFPLPSVQYSCAQTYFSELTCGVGKDICGQAYISAWRPTARAISGQIRGSRTHFRVIFPSWGKGIKRKTLKSFPWDPHARFASARVASRVHFAVLGAAVQRCERGQRAA